MCQKAGLWLLFVCLQFVSVNRHTLNGDIVFPNSHQMGNIWHWHICIYFISNFVISSDIIVLHRIWMYRHLLIFGNYMYILLSMKLLCKFMDNLTKPFQNDNPGIFDESIQYHYHLVWNTWYISGEQFVVRFFEFGS